jgi:hypothetical protein
MGVTLIAIIGESASKIGDLIDELVAGDARTEAASSTPLSSQRDAGGSFGVRSALGGRARHPVQLVKL